MPPSGWRRYPALGVLAGSLLLAPWAWAADGAAWLEKAARAARSASYAGTYVYSGPGITESARVSRLSGAGGDAERTESLDGSRREVVRRGDEIHYFFLDSKTVRIDRRVVARSFPDMLPQDPSVLGDSYRIETRGTDRVAGRPVQVIRLQSKDDSRFTQEVWADRDNGLPLKLRVIDARGEVIEQFAFTEVKIGARLDARQALPSRRTSYAGWKVDSASVTEALPGDPAAAGMPAARYLPPGFRKVAAVWRQLPGHQQRVLQVVYSDGLASLSVFVDPDGARVAGHEGISQRGALGVVARAVDTHAVITVGELPAEVLRKVAASVSAPRVR